MLFLLMIWQAAMMEIFLTYKLLLCSVFSVLSLVEAGHVLEAFSTLSAVCLIAQSSFLTNGNFIVIYH
jgi:hypothetical protein